MAVSFATAKNNILNTVRCVLCGQISFAPYRTMDVDASRGLPPIFVLNCCENNQLHCSQCATLLMYNQSLKGHRLRQRFGVHCQSHTDADQEAFVFEVLNSYNTATADMGGQKHTEVVPNSPEPPSNAIITSDSVDFQIDDDDGVVEETPDWFNLGVDPGLLCIEGVTNGTDRPSLYENSGPQQPSNDQLHRMFPNWTLGDIAEQCHDGRCYGDYSYHKNILPKVFPESIDEDLRINGIGALLPENSFLPIDTKKQATKLYSILMHMLYRGKRLTRTNQQKLVQVIQTSLDVGMNAVAMLKSSNADLKQSADVLAQNIRVFEEILVSI